LIWLKARPARSKDVYTPVNSRSWATGTHLSVRGSVATPTASSCLAYSLIAGYFKGAHFCASKLIQPASISCTKFDLGRVQKVVSDQPFLLEGSASLTISRIFGLLELLLGTSIPETSMVPFIHTDFQDILLAQSRTLF
jgi:hypothetical protein